MTPAGPAATGWGTWIKDREDHRRFCASWPSLGLAYQRRWRAGLGLLFRITCFPLVMNGENQDDVIRRKPTTLCDVAVAAARKHEFTPPFLGFAPQQRVVRQQVKRFAHA